MYITTSGITTKGGNMSVIKHYNGSTSQRCDACYFGRDLPDSGYVSTKINYPHDKKCPYYENKRT